MDIGIVIFMEKGRRGEGEKGRRGEGEKGRRRRRP